MRFSKKSEEKTLLVFESKLGPIMLRKILGTSLTQPWTKFFSFTKYAEATIFIAFSAKSAFLSPPPKIRNTICERNFANSFFLCPFFFSAFLFLGVFAVSVFGGSFFERNDKQKKTKFKTKQQKRKDDHKMQTTKPLSPGFF